VEKLSAVHVLLDTFGGSRTISNTSTTNFTQISTFYFDHSGQIVSASFQVGLTRLLLIEQNVFCVIQHSDIYVISETGARFSKNLRKNPKFSV